MAFTVPASTFTIDNTGIYILSLSGSFAHNSSNGGRTTAIRLFNITTGSPVGSELNIGIGRNDTVIPATLMFELPLANEDDVFRVDIGGGDSVTSVSFTSLTLSLWNVGEWRKTL